MCSCVPNALSYRTELLYFCEVYVFALCWAFILLLAAVYVFLLFDCQCFSFALFAFEIYVLDVFAVFRLRCFFLLSQFMLLTYVRLKVVRWISIGCSCFCLLASE